MLNEGIHRAIIAYLGVAALWAWLFSVSVMPRSKGEWIGLFLCVAFWPLWLIWAIFVLPRRKPW